MQDHPIFSQFRPYAGFVPLRSSVGFAGDFIHNEIEEDDQPWRPYARAATPIVDEEYFEWIDVLSAVRDAGPTFTMLEIGAGYGRWSVRGAKAARQMGKAAVIGVAEAEPKHLAWLARNFKQNKVRDYQVFEGVVDGETGISPFAVGTPEEGLEYKHWFGQAQLDYNIEFFEPAGRQYLGRDLYKNSDGWQIIKVPRITLSSILDGYERIDIVDMDIQGAEARAVAEAIAPLTRKVRRLHIGTHSHEIEAQLRGALKDAGWVLGSDYACAQENDTPYGRVVFVDGVQSWTNPQLA